MSAREELGEVICKALGDVAGIYDTSSDEDRELADAILAAGYSKPRTITTVEELDALHMAVIQNDAGSIANIVNGRAYFFGYEASVPSATLALPATVLYTPKES